MTDAGTKRALYCDELRIGAGRKRKAAMHRPRNRQKQQGGTTQRAQLVRNGATRVHGGEHGSGAPLRGTALAANDIPFHLRVEPFTLDDLPQLFGDPLD